MTILTVDKKEFERKVGKVTPELENKITDMGTPIEDVTDSELSVEVFPNRPDLLSLGNFARAVNQFNGKEKIASFKINEPEKNYEVIIEKSVKAVRPYTVCAIVKKMKFNNEKIKEIVDLQEKMHNSIGRKRKKIAIGIYPLDKITLPIRFVGRKPEDIKFLPLESKKEMNGKQILRSHPTGREYAHLLEGAEVFPIFIDAKNEILSMPPIINSEKTGRINESTKELFIECSGHNLAYLKKCMNIILSSIYDMGGKIYSMRIKDSVNGGFTSPDMKPVDLEFKIKDIEKTLGVELSEKDIRNYLSRMGIGYVNRGGKSIAQIPCYRADILHWIDLSEEIAIAYGYENFEAVIPEISTIAQEDKMEIQKKIIGNILAGCGLLETSTFHITSKSNIKKMHYDFKDFIELEDSKTERDVLRMDLITNLLQIASENSDAAYPQKIFEMGRVFSKDEDSETGIRESERLAISMIDEKISFTELKQVVDYMFKMLGIKYSIENVENSDYIIGRCGKIIVDDKEIGFIGEIAPRVLKNWKIKLPMTSMEIGLDFLE